MKPIMFYIKETCPAKEILLPYKCPVVTLNDQPLFTARGKPVKAGDIKVGKEYVVKIK